MKKYKLSLIFAAVAVTLQAVVLMGDIQKLIRLYSETPAPESKPSTEPKDDPLDLDWM